MRRATAHGAGPGTVGPSEMQGLAAKRSAKRSPQALTKGMQGSVQGPLTAGPLRPLKKTGMEGDDVAPIWRASRQSPPGNMADRRGHPRTKSPRASPSRSPTRTSGGSRHPHSPRGCPRTCSDLIARVACSCTSSYVKGCSTVSFGLAASNNGGAIEDGTGKGTAGQAVTSRRGSRLAWRKVEIGGCDTEDEDRMAAHRAGREPCRWD